MNSQKNNNMESTSDLNQDNKNNFHNNNINAMIGPNYVNNRNTKNQLNSIKQNFHVPPLIGLENIGATCYMNAVLQCFSQIEKFVNYFKYSPRIEEIIQKIKNNKKLCLTESFKYIIENLWPSNPTYIKAKYNSKNNNNSYFSPDEFKNKISEMNPLFRGVAANDSKDLVDFIIMTLHDELNKVKKNSQINTSNTQIDERNQQLVFQYFSNSFINENNSLISDLFYGISTSTTQCSGCQTIKYYFQIYFFLIFPLEEVRKFKIETMIDQFKLNNQSIMNKNPKLYQQNLMNYQKNCQNINSVNLDDCFLYNQKKEYFEGENSIYCNICHKNLPACYQTFLFTVPNILIIILNRGKGNEFKVKIEFNENLNLSNYVQRMETGYKYKLIGVITHLGEWGFRGHFIAFCRSPIDNRWYKYNDALVTEIVNFQQEIIDLDMPYILFYQKI